MEFLNVFCKESWSGTKATQIPFVFYVMLIHAIIQSSGTNVFTQWEMQFQQQSTCCDVGCCWRTANSFRWSHKQNWSLNSYFSATLVHTLYHDFYQHAVGWRMPFTVWGWHIFCVFSSICYPSYLSLFVCYIFLIHLFLDLITSLPLSLCPLWWPASITILIHPSPFLCLYSFSSYATPFWNIFLLISLPPTNCFLSDFLSFLSLPLL